MPQPPLCSWRAPLPVDRTSALLPCQASAPGCVSVPMRRLGTTSCPTRPQFIGQTARGSRTKYTYRGLQAVLAQRLPTSCCSTQSGTQQGTDDVPCTCPEGACTGRAAHRARKMPSVKKSARGGTSHSIVSDRRWGSSSRLGNSAARKPPAMVNLREHQLGPALSPAARGQGGLCCGRASSGRAPNRRMRSTSGVLSGQPAPEAVRVQRGRQDEADHADQCCQQALAGVPGHSQRSVLLCRTLRGMGPGAARQGQGVRLQAAPACLASSAASSVRGSGALDGLEVQQEVQAVQPEKAGRHARARGDHPARALGRSRASEAAGR